MTGEEMAHVTRSSLDGGLSDIFNHLKINKESVPGTQVRTLPGEVVVGESEHERRVGEEFSQQLPSDVKDVWWCWLKGSPFPQVLQGRKKTTL